MVEDNRHKISRKIYRVEILKRLKDKLKDMKFLKDKR